MHLPAPENDAVPQSARSLAGRIGPLLAHLPTLPQVLRYYDDYLEEWHTIQNYPTCRPISIRFDGYERNYDIGIVDPAVSQIVRHVALDWFGRLDAKTVSCALKDVLLYRDEAEPAIVAAVTMPPSEFRRFWVERFAVGALTEPRLAHALKQILYSLCRLSVGEWSADYLDSVEALPTTRPDQYTSLKSGDCFIPVEQQSIVVDHLDEVAALVNTGAEAVNTDDLRTACIVALTFQQGIRPGQTARVKREDVRIYGTGAIHIRFIMVKQKGKKEYVTRRIKREWCPLFIEYMRRREVMVPPTNVHPEAFFGLTPELVRRRCIKLSNALTGNGWTPGDYRHTAAQRLADAGASHAEISIFLMQTYQRTALVYYDASASQAAKVNRAMGLSRIYRGVADVAHGRMIDKTALLALPEDRQIGGIPHGVPIAGIGACRTGQSACVKNPVLSCYTCRRFLPVRDPALHRRVADDLRGVVRHFYDAGRGASTSPAFGQLRQTIEAADRVALDTRDVSSQEDGR